MKIRKEHGAKRERKVFPTECFVMSGQTLGVLLSEAAHVTPGHHFCFYTKTMWRLQITACFSPPWIPPGWAGEPCREQMGKGKTRTQNVPVSDSNNLMWIVSSSLRSCLEYLKMPRKIFVLLFFCFFVQKTLPQMYYLYFSPEHSADCDIFFKTPRIIMQVRVTIHMFYFTFVWYSHLYLLNLYGG